MPEKLNQLDERQSRIHQGLARFISPGTADWFGDACRLMTLSMSENPPVVLATMSHLVTHLLREVESALGSVLKSLPGVPPAAEDDTKVVLERGIREALTRAEVDADTSERALHEVADVALRWISQFEPRTGHKDRVRGALHALKISETEAAGRTWLTLASSNFAPRAHRSGLARPRPVDAEFRELCEATQAMLDRVLERVAVTFLPFLARARELAAEEQPTGDSRRKLLQELPQEETVVLREFFAHATPGWLDLLHGQNFFANPPPAVPGQGGSARLEDWPQAEYLARIAPLRPSAVSRILARIRTDNPILHERFLEAVLAMPAEDAVRVAPAAKHWVEQPYKLFENRRYGRLIAHLAAGGFSAEAADLARSVLDIVEPTPSGDTPEQMEISRWMRGPQPRIGTWDYRGILREDLPALAERDPEGTVVLLRDLLSEAIRIKRSASPFRRIFGQDEDGDHLQRALQADDGSIIWFPRIDGSGSADEVEALLVQALRRHVIRFADDDPALVARMVEALESGPWAVFHRISLHLLAQHPGAALSLVRERLLDPDRFDDDAIRPEYSALVSVSFPLLGASDRERYLHWVDEGLMGVAWRARGEAPALADLGLTDEDDDRWRHDRLAPVAEHLDPEWSARLATLQARIAAANAARHPARPAAPAVREVTVEEVVAMEVDDLLAVIGAGRTGDGSVVAPEAVAEAVGGDPARYADVAERFALLPVAYFNALMDGLILAIQRGPEFGWGAILSLAETLATRVAEGGDSTDQEAIIERVALVLERGLYPRSKVPIPRDLLDLVWPTVAVLVRLSTRPFSIDPGADQDRLRARGRIARIGQLTVEVLVRYGFAMRQTSTTAGAGHTMMPEVASALETYLALPHEEAPWVRETFARQFPYLVVLDRNWAEANRERVFPAGDEDWAAFRRPWEAYLKGGAWGAPAEVLAREYERAIDNLAGPDEEQDPLRGQRLAWHLVTLYYNGQIGLEEGGLLDRFFRGAPSELRGHALKLLARVIGGRKNVLTDEHRERLRELWENRLQRVDEASGAELTPLGGWFASGQFQPEWSLDHLRRTLALTGGRTSRPRAVVQRLAALSATHPAASLECLEILALGANGPVEVATWWDDATPILGAALATGEPLRTKVFELVNRLSAPPYAFARGGIWLHTEEENRQK